LVVAFVDYLGKLLTEYIEKTKSRASGNILESNLTDAKKLLTPLTAPVQIAIALSSQEHNAVFKYKDQF
jgi:hypothetical protein